MRLFILLYCFSKIDRFTESFVYKVPHLRKNSYVQPSNGFNAELPSTSKNNDSSSKAEKNIKNNSPSLASDMLFKTSENFGKLASLFSKNFDISTSSPSSAPSSSSMKVKKLNIDEMKNRLKDEYERIFWVTGNMDLSLWEDNCTFSDPFSYFGGTGSLKRFKTNADNFAKFVSDPKSKVSNVEVLKNVPFNNNKNNVDDNSKNSNSNADMKLYKTIDYAEYGPTVNIVKVSWSYSSKLTLPWKPILTAAGETSHYISNKTGKIFLYEERWKSNKGDVIARLFKPGK